MSIDATIAELRGQRCDIQPSFPDEKLVTFWYDGESQQLHPLPYSTDIRCAMELWDEMKDNGLIRSSLAWELAYDHVEGYRLSWSDAEDMTGEGRGKTPQLAICNAWLEWKNGLD